MSENISKEIVDSIETGKLSDAQDLIKQGLMAKAAEAVDMKRVETSVGWTDKKKEVGTEEE